MSLGALFAVLLVSKIRAVSSYNPDNVYYQYSIAPKESNLLFCLVLTASLLCLYVPTRYLFFSVPARRKSCISHVSSFLRSLMTGYGYLKSRYGNSQSDTGAVSLRKLTQRALKHGGNVGGLVNDGNTCFMNCVLQSLASSNDFAAFLQEQVNCMDGNMPENAQGDQSSLLEKMGLAANKDKKSYFIYALHTLLAKLNSKHGKRNSDYTVNSLVKRMSKGFEKHRFLGYNQEDAQEFFQLVLSSIEKEYQALHETAAEKTKYVTVDNGNIDNLNSFSSIGTYYIPAVQIDPSLENAHEKAFPFRFLTPADGLGVERIGCLKCGETGGLRYAVSSGLSLSLPADSSAYKANGYSIELDTLLQQYIEKEIIEGVECNRCSLEYVLEFLQEQVRAPAVPDVLKNKYLERIDNVKAELAKPIISDEAANAYKSKNVRQKGKKSKQAFISKPPNYLSLHLNRSVFDPQTGYIRKNNCSIDFPMKLDLNPYVASYHDVNVDARLSMRKQDDLVQEKKNIINQQLEKVKKIKHLQKSDIEDNNSEKLLNSDYLSVSNDSHDSEIFEKTTKDSDSASDVDDEHSAASIKQEIGEELKAKLDVLNKKIEQFIQPDLVYNLKAVIVHYGTHNYGHYIAFRKYRGVWWRISDESVEVVTENQVLLTPGVFMLFYEKPNAADEQYETDLDDEQTQSEDEVVDKNFKVEIDPEALQSLESSDESDEVSLLSEDVSDIDQSENSISDSQRDETLAIATPNL